MKLADKRASMALGMVGLLLVAGAGASFVVFANPFGLNANSPEPALQHNMTIQVGAVVEGRAIPIIGAEVSVWTASVNKTNDSVTITFTRVAHAVTGTGGNVTFDLAGGNYIVIANYSGLQSVKKVALDSDVDLVLFLHNGVHGHHGCGVGPDPIRDRDRSKIENDD